METGTLIGSDELFSELSFSIKILPSSIANCVKREA